MDNSRVKLQLFLSRNGVCSRREALKIIQAGKVSVNGRIVQEPSAQVGADDNVCVSGKKVAPKRYVYILLNKPRGYVTTLHDPHAQKTVMDLLPRQYRFLKPVGRLDKNTEGLLLFTNDGALANKLTHPSFKIDKTYFAKVKGALSPRAIYQIQKGIVLDGQRTAPAQVRIKRRGQAFTVLYLTIQEGRKRQIRRMFDSVQHPVISLQRLRQGPLQLGKLKRGRWRPLTEREIQKLKAIA